MSGREQLPVPVAPARGAKAGVRSDVSRNKDGSYNPVGTGSAWSHNFLNQKPWHPLNFRNQVRKFEAEQKAVDDFKAREAAMAEWQAEQERTTTLGFLSAGEAKKQRDRASISFMYQKPPGLEAALARDRELDDKKQREAAAAAAAAAAGDSQPQLQAPAAAAAAGGKPPLPSGSQQQQQQEAQQEAQRQRQQQLERLREDPFAAILAARSSLASSEKFVLKAVEGAFGGSVPGSENQLLLADEEEDDQQVAGWQPAQAGAAEIDEAEALLASLDPRERAAVLAALDKKRRRADKAARLQQAQDLLRSAGINPESLQAAAAADAGRDRGRSSSGRKRGHKEASRDDAPQQQQHKKHKKKHKKHKKSSKHKIHRKGRRSGSDSGNSSSGSSTDGGRSD